MKTYYIISKVYRFANIGHELPRVTHSTSHHNSLLETILVILLHRQKTNEVSIQHRKRSKNQYPFIVYIYVFPSYCKINIMQLKTT